MDGLSEVRARIGVLDAQLQQLRPAAATHVSFAETLRVAQATGNAASPPRASARAGIGPAAPAVASSLSTSAGRGQLMAGGAPAELARYGNGRIPAEALTALGGGQSLWTPAAQAFERMKRAADDAGVRLGVTDSYRSFAAQQDLVARKGLYSQGGLAAAPGTSDHGWGRSLDLRLDASAQAWMRQNASAYGFAENVAREPWHWTYSP